MCFYQTHIPILSPPTLLLFCPWYSLPISWFLFCLFVFDSVSLLVLPMCTWAQSCVLGDGEPLGVSWIEVTRPFPEAHMNFRVVTTLNWHEIKLDKIPAWIGETFMQSYLIFWDSLSSNLEFIHCLNWLAKPDRSTCIPTEPFPQPEVTFLRFLSAWFKTLL